MGDDFIFASNWFFVDDGPVPHPVLQPENQAPQYRQNNTNCRLHRKFNAMFDKRCFFHPQLRVPSQRAEP
jgi:hypothetical protein